jgi:flavin reductase
VAVSKQAYRDAMARLGAAVNVITSDGPGGRCGFTASAVCSVTDTPPTLLVCVNRNNDSYPPLKQNHVLCVNTLAGGHEDLSAIFAGLTECEASARFESGTWHTLVTGSPVLADATVAFDCHITEAVDIGTHTVFFCEVDGIQIGEAHEALIYYGRVYHRLVHKD